MVEDERSGAGGAGIGHALRRGWPLVLLVTLAALGASLLVATRQEPTYEATARLLVKPISQGETRLFGTDLISDSGDASQTAETTAGLVRTSQTATETARQLGGDWTAASVLDGVTVEPEGDGRVLLVTATSADPQAAAALATEFARSAIRLRRRLIVPQIQARLDDATERRRSTPEEDYSARDNLDDEVALLRNTLAAEGDPTLRLVDTARTPEEVSRTSPILITMLALLGGLLLGVLAAVGVDMLRRSLRSEQELDAHGTAPVLARIPRVRRQAGAIAPERMPGNGQEEFDALAIQLERLGNVRRVVAITSSHRGEGRTTVAANLALALAERGHSTALLDLDSTAGHHGQLLARSGDGTDLRILHADDFAPGVRAQIEGAAAAADWVIIDAPPLLEGAVALELAAEADEVLVVARLDRTDRRQLARALALLKRNAVRVTGVVLLGSRGSRQSRRAPASRNGASGGEGARPVARTPSGRA